MKEGRKNRRKGEEEEEGKEKEEEERGEEEEKGGGEEGEKKGRREGEWREREGNEKLEMVWVCVRVENQGQKHKFISAGKSKHIT